MSRLLCALAICLLAACSRQQVHTGAASTPAASPAATPRPRLLILATIAPMYCFTKNVVGDLADVEMIVPPGQPARGFQPTPDEVKRIMQADVVVENGFGFEDWMDRIEARGLRPGEIRVIAARGTGPGIPGLPGDPNTPPMELPPGMTGPIDPHVWLDPFMAIKEIQNIRDALMVRDPANANQYLANENQYEAALRDLDDEVGRDTVELTKRRLLCLDQTFLYFLSRYQFTAQTTETPRPDAILASIGQHPEKLNDLHIPIVFADPMENGPASTDYYEQGTRANVQALRKGLLQ
jgi:ABC-type Zn uptake system ZnuABC Zn-binding protein ZnuA